MRPEYRCRSPILMKIFNRRERFQSVIQHNRAFCANGTDKNVPLIQAVLQIIVKKLCVNYLCTLMFQSLSRLFNRDILFLMFLQKCVGLLLNYIMYINERKPTLQFPYLGKLPTRPICFKSRILFQNINNFTHYRIHFIFVANNNNLWRLLWSLNVGILSVS